MGKHLLSSLLQRGTDTIQQKCFTEQLNCKRANTRILDKEIRTRFMIYDIAMDDANCFTTKTILYLPRYVYCAAEECVDWLLNTYYSSVCWPTVDSNPQTKIGFIWKHDGFHCRKHVLLMPFVMILAKRRCYMYPEYVLHHESAS